MNDAARLIDALRNPACYDHPVEQVEVIETHISWVLLAGEFAYKVKKPVRLEFVDFSTLEKRRFFCEEELRLNRRLAERLYLAVTPIAGPVSSPRVSGSGQPREYAVKMRRFSQDRLLSHLLEQGRLTDEHIDRLARQAAEFHGRTAVADEASPWGSLENVRQPIDENFEELLAATPAGDPLHERLLGLQAWNREKLDELRETIVARKRNGFVRECHGDMHLGNIVLLPREGNSSGRTDIHVRQKEDGPGGPSYGESDGHECPSCEEDEIVIFDGIDFNENLRWIDVQNEIAFPMMDLDERGRTRLARRFLNAYLEASGDYEGLAVLPLFLSYRALVRAKVDWIRGHQTGVAGEERRRLGEEFARYLSLAERYARPPHPRLFLTHGVSGSGKSHFARRLAEEVGAVQIRSDVERKRLFGISGFRWGVANSAASRPAPGSSHFQPFGDEGLYSRDVTERTYGRLEQLTAAALAAGFSVIADATFLSRSHRERFRRLAERLRVPYLLLDFEASPETLKERIVARRREGADPSDADLEVLSRQVAIREPLDEAECAYALAIDAETPAGIEDALVAARRWSENR